MPSLFRFLLVLGTLCGIGFGGLYLLATQFEPQPREITQQMPAVKIRK